MTATIEVYVYTSKKSPSEPPAAVQNYPVRLYLYQPGQTQPMLFRAESSDSGGHVRFRVGFGHYEIIGGHQGEIRTSFEVPFQPEQENQMTYTITCDPVTMMGTNIQRSDRISNETIEID